MVLAIRWLGTLVWLSLQWPILSAQAAILLPTRAMPMAPHDASSCFTAGAAQNLLSLQAIVDQARSNAVLSPAPGCYAGGLVIRKAVTLNLAGVVLTGVAIEKGVLAVEKVKGAVVINDFYTNGRLSGADSGNLAAIRISGVDFDVTVNRADIANTAMGILTDNRGGRLVIRDSVVRDTGVGTVAGAAQLRALSHGIYAGLIDELRIERTVVLASHYYGHLVKSRATSTVIESSEIAGLSSRHSRVIDIPCGGELRVSDSLLQASASTDNVDILSMGVESLHHCKGVKRGGSLILEGNTIIADRKPSFSAPRSLLASNRLFSWRGPLYSLQLRDNSFINLGRSELLSTLPASATAPSTAVQLDGNRFYSSREAAGLPPPPTARD